MKYLLLALFAVTFVGHASSVCDSWRNSECIKATVNCKAAEICNADSRLCGQTERCYVKTPSCADAVSVVRSCSKTNQCTKPFDFVTVVEQKCLPKFGIASGAPALASFVSLTIYFLAYFAMKI